MGEMSRKIKPVILCGGNGTRLWPLSTPERPKQFLKLLGDKTMLEMTLDRVQRSRLHHDLSFGRPLVIGASRHGEWIKRLAGEADILLEPVGRNSAAPIAAAALASAPEDVLLVLPADHDIRDVDAFHEAIGKGFDALEPGLITTFGIVAGAPETAYGYIEATGDGAGARRVKRFVEKPDLETARAYVSSGNFFWNAGIFMFRAGDMIAAFEAYAPDILEAVRAAMPKLGGSGGGSHASLLDAEAFSRCRGQSIDYAIMEHHEGMKVVPVEMGWSDIGSFQALWERSAKDADGNVLVGDVKATGCRNSYIRAVDGQISVSGLERALVVKSGDDVFVRTMALAERAVGPAGR